MLKMSDEGGEDAKLLAVPTKKILPFYDHLNSLDDVNPLVLKNIAHFFEHYKDLEPGKWVKVNGWDGIEAAHKEITDGLAAAAKD
jgi:inorganic pyrophosphatase